MENPDRREIIAPVDSIEDRTLKLKQLMQKASINSFKQLYRLAGTSARTIDKIRMGKIETIRWQTLLNISNSLQISPIEFIDMFSDRSQSTIDRSIDRSLVQLQQEYHHLQQQLEQQKSTLQSEFQWQSLQTLESFLTYFPTAKQAAIDNPNFPATKLLPLIGAIDRLISQWGVTVIGAVGAEISYDPQYHQLIDGIVDPQSPAIVRYVGYQHGDKLLFRAKVTSVTPKSARLI
jgi:DNA-binding Xre family transcriptional regulator